MDQTGVPGAPAVAVTDKGLKRNAISFVSNAVIGTASAAPAYSLASALGSVAGVAAFATPAIMAIAFIPMVLIATAYYYLNRADPDCGTTFAWVTRTMGPHLGWIGGWALLVTNIIVMPSLAVIAGQYSFQLFGYGEPSTAYVTVAGVAWIVAMTAICYLGIELSARTQQVLLGTELAILLIFAAAALAKSYLGQALPGSARPALGWLNPFEAGSAENIVESLLVAVFVYWGWDTSASVNEETEDPAIAPGRAAVVSTFLLVLVYVLVAVAAIAFAGPALLSQHKDDIFAPIGEGVLGPWLDKLLIVAVLTSASAATQTTILPAARTALSMASAGAIPKRFAEIDPRYQSPGFATLVFGAVSIAWYAALTALSQSVLTDSILALGLCIAFYYGLTGFACTLLYRRELLKSAKNFVFMGVFPTAGALLMVFLFIESVLTLNKTATASILGLATPLAIGAASLLLGIVLMFLAQWTSPDFFGRKPE
jgi:amino acid transporter